MVIHQPSIPAMPGNEGFKTEAVAIKVAQLIIKKIKKGKCLLLLPQKNSNPLKKNSIQRNKLS
jgi:hypothetical protein